MNQIPQEIIDIAQQVYNEDGSASWHEIEQLAEAILKAAGKLAPPEVRVPDCFPDHWMLRQIPDKDHVSAYHRDGTFIVHLDSAKDLIVTTERSTVSDLRKMQAEYQAWLEKQLYC